MSHPIIGPFARNLREVDFTDATAGAGVTATTVYVPLAYFRIPLAQAFEVLPSTQWTTNQMYWAQGLAVATSGAPAVTLTTAIRLERRDASGNVILDIFDDATAGDVPTIANSVSQYNRRYFTRRIVLKQDEYLYLSCRSTSAQTVSTVSPTGLSTLLIRLQYYIKT